MFRPVAALAVLMLLHTPTFAQEPATAQPPAPQASTPPSPRASDVIALVRAALNQGDFEGAEKALLRSLAQDGTSAASIEAVSWLARGAYNDGAYDKANTYALQTFALVSEQLLTSKLDDESHLPIALGAAIEVVAQIQAKQGARSEAVAYLRSEAEKYKDTSIAARIHKNINLLSLEGTPALPLDRAEWLGPQPAALSDLKGKPVVLFLWAHWCPDCKAQGPVLETLFNKYKGSGLTVVAPTQRYGYVAQRKPASLDDELAYITEVRDQYYPWLKTVPVPVSQANFTAYGVSSTPTLVLIDRAGNVAKYNPGRMSAAELEAAIRTIVGK
jgi:thiol-disulfide isomerase/thioredoxin